MARVFCLLVVLSLICTHASAETHKASWEYPAIKIRGWHAQAVAVALREFQRNQGGKTDHGEPVYGDLVHYSVYVAQSPPDQLPLPYAREECVRVSLIPDLSARDRREVTLGGRTHFGIEVSYDITRRTIRIVKTSFAR